MSQEKTELLASQITRALEAAATVAEVSQAVIETVATMQRTIGELESKSAHQERTMELMETFLWRGPEAVTIQLKELTSACGGLKDSCKKLEAAIEKIDAKKLEHEVRVESRKAEFENSLKLKDHEAKWNLKSQYILWPLGLLAALLIAAAGAYFGSLFK